MAGKNVKGYSGNLLKCLIYNSKMGYARLLFQAG
jgi:hypothetical protein